MSLGQVPYCLVLDCCRRGAQTLVNLRSFATSSSSSLRAIKALREKSGAPISEVKAALEEAQYDLGVPMSSWARSPSCNSQQNNSSRMHAADSAFQVLRKRGLAAANKKVNYRC